MKLSSLIAGAFGIVGFVLSVFAGLLADNSLENILVKALICTVVCYIVGYLVGLIGQQVSAEHAVRLAKFVAEEDAAKEQKDLEAAAAIESQNAQRTAPQVPTAAAPTVAKT